MEYPWAMVQINDGLTCVTAHKTEDDAYNDIIDTCLEAPEWLTDLDDVIDLCDDDGKAEVDEGDSDTLEAVAIRKLAEIRQTMSPKGFYDQYMEPRLEGISAGFYMEVCPLLGVEA